MGNCADYLELLISYTPMAGFAKFRTVICFFTGGITATAPKTDITIFNDIGAYRMAQIIGSVVADVLSINTS